MEAVICLGVDQRVPNHRVEMDARVRTAIDSFRTRRARYLILTGGRVDPHAKESEARQMARIATRLGVPRERVILEEHAWSTVGNAYFSNIILHDRRIAKATVVTSAIHVPRAEYVFRHLIYGVTLRFVPSPTHLRVRDMLLFALSEAYKSILMRLRGIYLRPEERLQSVESDPRFADARTAAPGAHRTARRRNG